MNTIWNRYRLLFFLLLLNLTLCLMRPDIGWRAAQTTVSSLSEMLLIMPPIFILLGFLDVWVNREIMIKYLGPDAGIRGILTALLIGSIAAGPGYMAFPFTAVLLSKGASFTNILIFVGAWSATKVPIALFEASVMGWPFMLLRYALDVPSILLIAWCTNGMLSKAEREKIYREQQKKIAGASAPF